MTVYEIALLTHSYVRWLLLLAAMFVIVGSSIGWRGDRAWSPMHERTHRALVGLADLQFMIGTCLYLFWSPFADAFIHNLAVAMKERTLRFFGLEHPTMMLLAMALLHVGRKQSQREWMCSDVICD